MASGTIRFEVSPKAGQIDPFAQGVLREARALGFTPESVTFRQIYFVAPKGDQPLTSAHTDLIARSLLADAVAEQAVLGAAAPQVGVQVIEVHPLPGVMDPVAQTVEMAIADVIGISATVTTGKRYDILGLTSEQADTLARTALSNSVIQKVYRQPVETKPEPKAVSHDRSPAEVAIRTLSDEQLVKLSREAHLFLSLEEMQAIQAEYRRLNRDPRDIELETLAQTWSEHCVHKTLKSRVLYTPPKQGESLDFAGRAGHTVQHDGTVRIENLLKSTVAQATFDLIDQGVDWTLSVFKDNSGIIAFDETLGVCIKVETHNRPSAIEPYGGAATGIGGCIRDIMGTGLGAKPIASTDVFCTANPASFAATAAEAALGKRAVPKGLLHPARTLKQVVAGVRDYGNRMGIPTVNGAVFFDDRYIGNPLVFCGCIGIIPRDKVKGQAKPGDRIIAIGGRTGRDGVHGATFSSAGLEDKSADEFAHAVQIGNAIEEKRTLDAILQARDNPTGLHGVGPLYNAMTDCGAGGFSSAVGEMGSELGAEVHLERAPLKYPGLSYTEIWISEAQERMVLAVPPDKVEALRAIAARESVEIADLGHFGTAERDLILNYHGSEVGRLSMHFVHDGVPTPVREARWQPLAAPSALHAPHVTNSTPHLKDALLTLLAHPNIASKHWIIRQYDHEVQGNTVVKPLVGPRQQGPSDAAVVMPRHDSNRGIAISCGLQTWTGDAASGGDPYQLALAGIDEAIRNAICTGANPSRIAILDNFCWPGCNKPENLGALVRACEGCYDGAMAYRTPFVSGKDSLNNQFTTETGEVIEIPCTLLITAVGIVDDVDHCVTTDAKSPGNILLHIGSLPHDHPAGASLAGSHAAKCWPHVVRAGAPFPAVDLTVGPATARTVAAVIAAGLVRSAHDVSDGGLLCAVAEMLIGGVAPGKPIGAELDLAALSPHPFATGFCEGPSRYVLEVTPADVAAVAAKFAAANTPCTQIGTLNSSGVLTTVGQHPRDMLSVTVNDLAAAWRGTLDW